ncbi:MAG: phosphatase PAP2 family protein [Planctomycetota bacterium]|nr:phosphatase PAP2 family protein [Planctomycetota bacterium]
MTRIFKWIGHRPFSATAFLLVGLVGCALLDPLVLREVHLPAWETADSYRLLRVCGYFPTWLAVAWALVLVDRRSKAQRGGGWHPAALLLSAVALSGLASVVLKILVRRLRPDEAGQYAARFRPFSDHFLHGGGLSFPSEHAAVAFPACFVLCRLFPRAWPVWLLWASGCALTRLTQRAHFLSDVYASMLLGLLACEIVWRLWGPRNSDAELDDAPAQ